ncbi:hypothetical protein KIN20_014277 [Parelaphostrongylus tenuis]|uniref:Uncharacterized protein n=1 Tax=Parelaphostrongylus tenuis TaxID=148309 RepID=A0AAD5QN86_PARTN|nr:hypothetical protein KIN20_014277 [Parelaphostrongylus tenuis]
MAASCLMGIGRRPDQHAQTSRTSQTFNLEFFGSRKNDLDCSMKTAPRQRENRSVIAPTLLPSQPTARELAKCDMISEDSHTKAFEMEKLSQSYTGPTPIFGRMSVLVTL